MKLNAATACSVAALLLLVFTMMPPVGAQKPMKQDTWPELVGRPVEMAKELLSQVAPGYNIQVIPFGHFATEDYRQDRIRLWLGEDGTVGRVPRIG